MISLITTGPTLGPVLAAPVPEETDGEVDEDEDERDRDGEVELLPRLPAILRHLHQTIVRADVDEPFTQR